MEKPSLISRDESSAIKGLLMLLIIFGHTSMLTTNFATGDRTYLWNWLYTFHVFVFFILPFIYGYKRKRNMVETRIGGGIDYQEVIAEFKRNLVKLFIPYVWFCIISGVLFLFIGGGTFNPKGMIYAIVFGNQPALGQYFGFNLLWFLPAMLAMLTLRSIYYNSNKHIRISIVAISLILWGLWFFRVFDITVASTYVPFAISQGFYFIIFGLLSRWLIEKHWPNKYVIPIVLLLIALFTWIDWKPIKLPHFSLYAVMRMLMPVLVFMFLYVFRNLLSKSKLLKLIGTYSLQIYLIHVFIINALNVLFLHFTKESVGLGVVIYVLTIIISIVLAMIMVKVPIINKVLFPKEWWFSKDKAREN